jgi:hypothetical protein
MRLGRAPGHYKTAETNHAEMLDASRQLLIEAKAQCGGHGPHGEARRRSDVRPGDRSHLLLENIGNHWNRLDE